MGNYILIIIWIVVLIADAIEQRKGNKINRDFQNKKIENLEERNSLLMKMVDVEEEKAKALLSAMRNICGVDKKQTMSAAEMSEILTAFQRYLEFTPVTVVATLCTCNGLEILCQDSVCCDRFVLYARIVEGELIIENEKREMILDYTEEMDLSEEQVAFIRFGKKK